MATYYFKYLVCLHILKDIQDLMRNEDRKGRSHYYWELCKQLCGEEHAQFIYEVSIPDEVRSHSLLYSFFR